MIDFCRARMVLNAPGSSHAPISRFSVASSRAFTRSKNGRSILLNVNLVVVVSVKQREQSTLTKFH